MSKKRLLLLPITGPQGAASRYRVYAMLPYLEKAGFEVTVRPAVSDRVYRRRVQRPGPVSKMLWLLQRAWRRLAAVFEIRRYDLVLLQRETLPLLWPGIDLLLCSLARKIVFDFDDAIYAQPGGHSPWWADRRRIDRILRRCDAVVVANAMLADYARQHNTRVQQIPTAIDLAKYEQVSPPPRGRVPRIGWVGSPFTVFYLQMLFPVFAKLAKKYEFEVVCIGAEVAAPADFSLVCQPWRLESEVQDIKAFDIGVMPLTDDAWSRGKSGLKLLQYLAAGVAAVASPVGVNAEIIEHGKNGLLARTPEEWEACLGTLLEQPQQREALARQGLETVRAHYALEGAAEKLMALLQRVTNTLPSPLAIQLMNGHNA